MSMTIFYVQIDGEKWALTQHYMAGCLDFRKYYKWVRDRNESFANREGNALAETHRGRAQEARDVLAGRKKPHSGIMRTARREGWADRSDKAGGRRWIEHVAENNKRHMDANTDLSTSRTVPLVINFDTRTVEVWLGNDYMAYGQHLPGGWAIHKANQEAIA